MEMPIGDIIDRYSICKLKAERLSIDNKTEMDCLWKEIEQHPDVFDYVEKLYEINGKIWDLESDIRQGNEDILGLEEVGKRAIKIRNFNGTRVQYKNEINSKLNQGFIEIKMNHGSQKEPSVIISLTTVPERLSLEIEDGLKLVLKQLGEQNDSDYEVHFNVPFESFVTKKPYVIPSWLDEYKLKYPHLKIFRTKDFGPPTKIIPTLERITNPETIIIVVDDDLVYHKELVKEHRKYQDQLKDCVICYDGRGTDIRQYGDIRDDWILCVLEPTITHGLQHYKSASYKRKLFTDEFFTDYIGKTYSDDILVSLFFRNNKIKMYVVPYEPDKHLFETTELWNLNQGVTSFPVLRYASSVENTGCNNPSLLSIQRKFYSPPELERTTSREVVDISCGTDKNNHGYFAFYNPIFSKFTAATSILEIGVLNGGSLRLWEKKFKNAQVYGIDIADCSNVNTDRIKTFIAEQADREQLKVVLENINTEFDIIIDDGGHTMKQQQVSFGYIFKHLKSGGVYILEDLHTSKILDRHYIDRDDEITTLEMLERYKVEGVITSNHMTQEEIEYLNNNIQHVEIWTRTPDKAHSVTSAIYKK